MVNQKYIKDRHIRIRHEGGTYAMESAVVGTL